jgi:muramoyltetrapeptide carboxypeptidase
MEPRYPAALRPGDQVRLVSPAGPTHPERVTHGIDLLESWGLKVTLGDYAFGRTGFLAGTDDQRLADLNDAFRDPDVRGVICTRGGYGSQRIVDGIDFAAVAADPKILMGFSDITAVQFALWRGARLVTLHGPGAAWLPERTPEASMESWRRAMMTTDPIVIPRVDAEETAAVCVPGTATGPLLGGNLCLIEAALATVDFPDLTGAILLLEEIEEEPYRIDRMLTHLRRAGVLETVNGVAIGQFTGCADGWPVSVADVLSERLSDLGVPVLGGLPVGHGVGQLTVPLGVSATIDTDAGTLTAGPGVRA